MSTPAVLTTGQIRSILKSGNRERIARIPQEDLQMFFENESQRELISMEGIKNLYSGICERAVQDYKNAYNRRTLLLVANGRPSRKTREEEENEAFLGSEFFLMVSGMRNKEETLKAIRQSIIDEKRRKDEEAKKQKKTV